jgi:hypothetical protein
MAASMKMTAFWDIALCSLVEVDQLFRGAYCLHHQADDTGTDFALSPLVFPLSVSFNCCSMFTYVSSGGWIMRLLVAHFHRDISLPHCNN